MKIPNKVRYMNKKFLNRLMIKIAGKNHSPIALIRHRGRVTGRIYETPIIVAQSEDGFMFALTYGWQVDWYQNLLAEGEGILKWQGCEYTLYDPRVIDSLTGRTAYGQPQTAILGWLKMEDFAHMRSKLCATEDINI